MRGFSGVSLIIEDEAAFVPDDLYIAVRPMLAVSRGRLILMSTPNGTRGHFYLAWADGEESPWERVRITAQEVPRIDPAHLEEERRGDGRVEIPSRSTKALSSTATTNCFDMKT